LPRFKKLDLLSCIILGNKMSENIDIRIREDGSRAVSRSMDSLAAKAEQVDKSVKGMNKTLDDTAKSGTSLQRLRGMVQEIDSFNSTMVDRMGRNLTQYRNTLMKHFEMVSREAKASAASLKSQMEAMTSSPIGMDALNEYYRNQEKASAELIQAIAKDMAAQEQIENQSYARRLKTAMTTIVKRQELEQSYSAFWTKELDKRDKQDAAFIASAAKNLSVLEAAEVVSNEKRLQSAMSAINARKAAEEGYTAWWAAEMKKRDAANSASNLRTATQRSGMQTVNAERLDRSLIKGPNPQSALYAADDTTKKLGQKTALQTAETQAMQRQMAMYSLLAPMIEKELSLNTASIDVVKQNVTAKSNLASTHDKLSSSTRTATDNQRLWNQVGSDGHAVARGLSGSLGTLWMTYGSILPLLTGAALGSAFVGAAKSGSEMAYQLQFVKSLGNESADAISKLNEQANQLAVKGAFGPTQIASGYRILAQAGLDAKESLAAMPNVLNLATVGELDMESAGIALVGTLNAFKLGFDQSAHIADLFAKAAAASQASVQDLTQSMKYGSTVGTQYKQNVDQTMAALALLAKVNVTGTSAGTAYRNMLKELYTPTKEVTKVWEQLGIKMQEAVKGPDGKEVQKVKSFVDIINELRTKMNKLDEPSQVKLKGFLGGERGSKEMVAMLDLTEKQWDDFYSRIAEKSKGFAKSVADELNATAKNEWKAALNTLEVELASSFKRMEPEFVTFSTTLKGIFQSDEFKSALDTIIAVTISAGQTFLELAPLIYDLAKAWLVLKAAQVGAGIASMLVSTGAAAMNLAGGMLAASGAMGPVARGASTLAPLLAMLGGPLAIILGLLTAGAAAWLLWGRNSETASGKAIKTAEEKLKSLKEQAKYGGGELGKERAELDKLQEIYDLRNRTIGLDRKHVDEAYKAVQLQQELVNEMEKAQNLALKPAKIEIPKVETNPVGTGVWNPPGKEDKSKGPSGRLGKDESALAKLQAQLLVAEKEYATISMTGEAQYKLNEGFQKAFEIQQKTAELEAMSTADLKEKGIKGRADQLAIFKQEYDVAVQLGQQLQANELLKVDSKMAEEVRLAQLLPTARETENKFIQFRNELLSKGVLLDAAQTEELRKKVTAQIQLNKETAARDQFLASSNSQKLTDTNTSVAGLKQAQQSPDWAQGDTAQAADSMLKSMGFDTSATQTAIDAQLNQVSLMYAQLKTMKEQNAIDQQTFDVLTTQTQMKEFDIRTSNQQKFFGQMAVLATSKNKQLSAIGKAAAITQAVIDTYKSATGAYASMSSIPYVGPALGAAAAAAAIAAGMANVDKIRSQSAFATGGGFTVGGSGGVDSQMVSFRASPGERVAVSTPTQVRKGDEANRKNQNGQGGNSSQPSVKVINVVDPNLLHDYMSSAEGERVLLNTLQRNSGAVRNVINN
jgi:TP901 family phage tail tape measure protein